jgi:hypothetical protein
MPKFMTKIPYSVVVRDNNGIHNVGDDDTVFCLTIQDFMVELQNSREFYENPAEDVMIKVLTKYMAGQIYTLRVESNWYIRKAMPVFMRNNFKKMLEQLPKAS